MTTYSYEKLGLQEQLTAQQAELEKKEKELADLEYQLYQKQIALNNMQSNFGEMEGSLTSSKERIRALQQQLSTQEAQMQNMKDQLNRILGNFSASDLSVRSENGKIYVSMSQNLLFRSGSDRIDQNGRNALRQLASALASNPDIEILVEGHTDADGSAASNWLLSTRRAVSVVNLLVEFGLDPQRLTASGKGEHVPVATNNTAANKAKNRRTEIILAPKLQELYSIMNN